MYTKMHEPQFEPGSLIFSCGSTFFVIDCLPKFKDQLMLSAFLPNGLCRVFASSYVIDEERSSKNVFVLRWVKKRARLVAK